MAVDAQLLRGPGLLASLLGLICLETALFLLLAGDRLDTQTYLASHLGICAITGIVGIRWIRTSAETCGRDLAAIVLHAVAWTVLAGPFGALIVTALLVPRSATGRLTVDASARVSDVAPLDMLHGALLDHRLRLEHAHVVRPLLDVIIEGTQIEKLDALSLISKHYSAALAPALRRALEDGDSAVRVLAATVMAQQHNTYTKRIGALQSATRMEPESSAHRRELAQAHLQYAQSGLLEPSRADAEKSQARALLGQANEPKPGNADETRDET